jgi:uncharacterized protein YyaL (SSP411 family)
MANQLHLESSPYLLQHASNPIHWVAWSPSVFERAKAEDKIVLISIGYSACHWCHVMEHECFEDEEVANFMNAHFIAVKVDREERPDVDHIYMTAVQLMTQKGGWPLNCFTLPDGRPIYGGTYFPKDQWMHVLRSLVHTYANDRAKALEYAQQVREGIARAELIDAPVSTGPFSEEKAHEMVVRWARSFDTFEGGTNRAPKFPLPNNWKFLMRYALQFDEERIHKHVQLSLDKMAFGGIYDQIGGGFTRYSVDVLWKVPHFEKMLYDNGQLIELYAAAFAQYKTPLYHDVVRQTVAFLVRELKAENGAFYSALDADSEGEEGKFYCWNPEEIRALFPTNSQRVIDYFNINQRGYWEANNYIPLRTQHDHDFAKQQGLDINEWLKEKEQLIDCLLRARSERTRPGLDHKQIVSWNAQLAIGLLRAFQVFSEPEYLLLARGILNWIKQTQWQNRTLLRICTNGQGQIPGFLEDYAHSILAALRFYECSAEREFLEWAIELGHFVEQEFQHPESKMCFFSQEDQTHISRTMELNDNVMPSSNSAMAQAFYELAFYAAKPEWLAAAKQMLQNVYDGMENYSSGYSNWGLLLLEFLAPRTEWHVLTSDKASELVPQIPQPAFISYHQDNACSVAYPKGAISVCSFGACHAPVQRIEEALKYL